MAFLNTLARSLVLLALCRRMLRALLWTGCLSFLSRL